MKEIKQSVVVYLKLSENDISELLPSGKQSVFVNRIGWCRTYLKKTGLIESPARAQFLLTEEGKRALPDADIIDDKYLRQFPSFRAFQNLDDATDEVPTVDSTEKSSEETLEDAFADLNNSLADDHMAEIMKLEQSDLGNKKTQLCNGIYECVNPPEHRSINIVLNSTCS